LARNRSKKHVPLDELNIPPKGTKPARTRERDALREAARRPITDEEADALSAAFFAGQPLVAAILGQCMVEYELDRLFRFTLKRVGDPMWSILTKPEGALGTFSRKIDFAEAIGLISGVTAKKLDAIRRVRNKFAHSQRLLQFDDPLIVAELRKARFTTKERGYGSITILLSGSKIDEATALVAYRNICDLSAVAILRRHNKGLRMKNMNLKRNQERRKAAANPFSWSLPKGGLAGLLQTPLQTSAAHHHQAGSRAAIIEALLYGDQGKPKGA
jgi:hypothetical protein